MDLCVLLSFVTSLLVGPMGLLFLVVSFGGVVPLNLLVELAGSFLFSCFRTYDFPWWISHVSRLILLWLFLVDVISFCCYMHELRDRCKFWYEFLKESRSNDNIRARSKLSICFFFK